jgi:hypothetical protein
MRIALCCPPCDRNLIVTRRSFLSYERNKVIGTGKRAETLDNYCKRSLLLSGRCWVRTSDLCRVKSATPFLLLSNLF